MVSDMFHCRLLRHVHLIPLLCIASHLHASPAHPFLDRSFQIPWSALTADCLEADVDEAIRQGRTAIEAISHLQPEEITYENTFGTLEQMNAMLGEVMSKAGAMNSLCDSVPMRQASGAATPKAAAFMSSITKNQLLWQTLKTAETRLQNAPLTPDQQRAMNLCMQNFRNNGANLSPEDRARLETIDREIVQCAQQFKELHMDARKHWSWTVRDLNKLEGINRETLQRASARHRNSNPADTAQGWMFTADSISADRVMEQALNENFRKELWEQLQTLSTGKFDTESVVKKMVSLRAEKAKLCGYDNYSDYALQQSMAGSGEAAMKFIDDLLSKLKPSFFRDMEKLRVCKAEMTGRTDARLYPWDVPYYSEHLATKQFNMNREELRQYFPLNEVLKGLFSVTEQMYGIKVIEIPVKYALPGTEVGKNGPAVEVWHPDVRFFDVYDDDDGRHLGSFYLDLFSRKSKRAGAWMSSFYMGTPPSANHPGTPRLGMIGMNIQKTSGTSPILLSHLNVKTLFHEFGHLLHLMFTKASIPSLGGTNVPRDFVEVPSQLMENWCWNPAILKSFARHCKTGQTIPDEILLSLTASQSHLSSLSLTSQLLYSKTDLAVHKNPELLDSQPFDRIDSVVAGDMEYFKDTPASGKLRTARHLFSYASGYASFYFSYRWAEVLEKDIFETFEKQGLLNKSTAKAFRTTILEKGYTAPSMELFQNFMGRAPSMDAMLRKRQLAEDQKH